MHCLEKGCGSSNLYAHVQASLAVPMSQRRGTVNTKGVVVKQTDVKAWWDKNELGHVRRIRGPIICADCGAEHVYLKGLVPALRLLSYAEACELGYEHFADTSERDDEDTTDE
jgi:hypothetical protein